MLGHLGQPDAAARLMRAVERVRPATHPSIRRTSAGRLRRGSVTDAVIAAINGAEYTS